MTLVWKAKPFGVEENENTDELAENVKALSVPSIVGRMMRTSCVSIQPSPVLVRGFRHVMLNLRCGGYGALNWKT